MSAPAIEARNLTAGYGKEAVIKGINIVVNPGEVVALLGSNGAGKTTTMLTLSGELPPLDGEVLIGSTLEPSEAARLEGLEVNIPAQANEEDTLFGSVTAQDVVEALSAALRAEGLQVIACRRAAEAVEVAGDQGPDLGAEGTGLEREHRGRGDVEGDALHLGPEVDRRAGICREATAGLVGDARDEARGGRGAGPVAGRWGRAGAAACGARGRGAMTAPRDRVGGEGAAHRHAHGPIATEGPELRRHAIGQGVAKAVMPAEIRNRLRGASTTQIVRGGA